MNRFVYHWVRLASERGWIADVPRFQQRMLDEQSMQWILQENPALDPDALDLFAAVEQGLFRGAPAAPVLPEKLFPFQPFAARYRQIEDAGQHMRRGGYEQAVAGLASIDAGALPDDGGWLMVALSIRGTCFQALGRYAEAEQALAQQEELAREFSCESYSLLVLRRRVSLLLEREDFLGANLALAPYLAGNSVRPQGKQKMLLWLERVRLALVRGNVGEAARLLAEIEETRKTSGVPHTHMSCVEERSELDLLLEAPAGVTRERIFGHLRAVQAAHDRAGECAALLMYARACERSGDVSQALASLEASLRCAEDLRHEKMLCRASLFETALLHRQGQHVRARLALARATGLALRLGLPVQQSCCTFVQTWMRDTRALFSPLVHIYARQRSFVEISHYLGFLGVQRDFSFFIRQSTGSVALRVEALKWIPSVFSSRLCLFVPDEGVLFAFGRDGQAPEPFVTLNLEPHSILFQVLCALADCATARSATIGAHAKGAGLSLSQLHMAIWRAENPEAGGPAPVFREDRHGPRLRMAIARLRKSLRLAGLDVQFDRNQSDYRLCGDLDLFVVEPSGTFSMSALTPREREVVSYIAEHQPVRTSELIQQMGITRQSLHPVLRNLSASGWVRLEKKGPASAYVLRAPCAP